MRRVPLLPRPRWLVAAALTLGACSSGAHGVEPTGTEPNAPVTTAEPTGTEPNAPVTTAEPTGTEPTAPVTTAEPTGTEPTASTAPVTPDRAETSSPAAPQPADDSPTGGSPTGIEEADAVLAEIEAETERLEAELDATLAVLVE